MQGYSLYKANYKLGVFLSRSKKLDIAHEPIGVWINERSKVLYKQRHAKTIPVCNDLKNKKILSLASLQEEIVLKLMQLAAQVSLKAFVNICQLIANRLDRSSHGFLNLLLMRKIMCYQKSTSIIKKFMLMGLHSFMASFFYLGSFFNKQYLRIKMHRKRTKMYKRLNQERNKYLKRYLMLAQTIRRF